MYELRQQHEHAGFGQVVASGGFPNFDQLRHLGAWISHYCRIRTNFQRADEACSLLWDGTRELKLPLPEFIDHRRRGGGEIEGERNNEMKRKVGERGDETAWREARSQRTTAFFSLTD